jgi:hypothetical protein
MMTCRSPQSGHFDVYTIALPHDSRIPRRQRRKGAAPPAGAAVRRLLPASVGWRAGSEENEVWFRWVVGHQHLFLYWIVQADLCARATRALQAGKWARATQLLRRLAVLRWGEIAAMLNCGNLASALYQAVLRPKMELVRADFSARSAQDYLAMETVLTALRKTLRQLPYADEALEQAQRVFQRACAQWKEHHIEVAERLQPGISLAVIEYQRLRDQGLGLSFPQYVDTVIQSTEAMAQYDRFFGVERLRMDLQDFAETALEVVAQAHRILALPREQLKWVLRGDHLLVAYLDHLLRAPAQAPAS